MREPRIEILDSMPSHLAMDRIVQHLAWVEFRQQ